ncbi:MAG: peptide deformylase [Melioribacteraceae bacterium]|nr:peptide deformylase [Melioribacteraceae bacterium]
MAVLPITVYGDKVLRQKAIEIEAIDDELIKNIQDMFETMRESNGIGLAANQVGLLKKMFVIDLSPVEDYEDLKPIVMINPEIIKVSDETWKMEEGCLSLPGLGVNIERSFGIQIKYLDPNEEEKILEVDDFYARVIQHEYDHLIGKLMPDRTDAFTKRKIKGDLMRIMKREVNVDYEITERK